MKVGFGSGQLMTEQADKRLGLTSRKHRVTTSVAEDAVFIPKPYKRVSFKAQAPEFTPLGGGNTSQPLPTLGGGNGENIKAGTFGSNGLSARFNGNAYQGRPKGYVRMDVDYTPSKQYDVIATQEEGRQINNEQVHFTQQYDSYGRPRIGFSREPYDFAATKFVSITSQVSFQRKMADTHEKFDAYLLGSDSAKEKVEFLGEEKGGEAAPILGSDTDTGRGNVDVDEFFLGSSMAEGGKDPLEKVKEAMKEVDIELLGDGETSGMDEAVARTFSGSIDTDNVRTFEVSA